MRYILMMHQPRGTGEYQSSDWSPEDLRAHYDYWNVLNRGLSEAGELVAVEALAPPGQAKLVRAGKGGAPPVTDGPFAEAKEFLAGYWIVEVDKADRAFEIAAQASAAPGPGGTPLLIPIEVRQVMRSPAAGL